MIAARVKSQRDILHLLAFFTLIYSPICYSTIQGDFLCDPLKCYNEDGVLLSGELIPAESCDYYCICTLDRAQRMKCPKGLHFNKVLKVCDFPSNAKCQVLYNDRNHQRNSNQLDEKYIEDRRKTELSDESLKRQTMLRVLQAEERAKEIEDLVAVKEREKQNKRIEKSIKKIPVHKNKKYYDEVQNENKEEAAEINQSTNKDSKNKKYYDEVQNENKEEAAEINQSTNKDSKNSQLDENNSTNITVNNEDKVEKLPTGTFILTDTKFDEDWIKNEEILRSRDITPTVNTTNENVPSLEIELPDEEQEN